MIGPHVEIGAGSRIGPHAVITGHTRIGARNRIFQFTSLGEVPQDKKYRDEPTRLEIGDGNTIREFCTFNCGTAQDAGVTRVGNGNWFMAYVHLAHDCQVGNHTMFANNAQLARARARRRLRHPRRLHRGAPVLPHRGAQHHRDRHGRAAGRAALHDGLRRHRARPYGINVEGLKRRGFTADTITRLKRAYKTLYRSGLTLDQAKEALARQVNGVPGSPGSCWISWPARTRGIIR